MEGAAWQAVETLARQSKRVIDEVYALVNRVFIKLRTAEKTCYGNPEELDRKVQRIQAALKARAKLFEAYEHLALSVKLPTPHAHLQCIVIDALMVYYENYFNVSPPQVALEFPTVIFIMVVVI